MITKEVVSAEHTEAHRNCENVSTDPEVMSNVNVKMNPDAVNFSI
jgi:hypothetical protein